MSKSDLILSLDQGTTSSRAIVFDQNANIVVVSQREFPQHYPHNAWVEHDPEDIWMSTLDVAKQAVEKAESNGGRVACIGITNQRETTILWDRETQQPVYNAIVWQDRRTAAFCQRLKDENLEEKISAKTGLLLDPYFSASKIRWILDNVDDAENLANAGRLAFGTVDSFLIARLTGGKQHLTDITNASRTNIFNIHTQDWDDELLDIFGIPRAILPEVRECADDFGLSDKRLFGREIPILGVAGDQQAAAIGQCCFTAGDTKSTYGTGCFALMNTGAEAVRSSHRLLTTVGYRVDGQTHYALEGSIFVAGAAVQWLRDTVGLVEAAAETETLAASIADNDGVYLVPAFTGLGAPYWEPDARAALLGMTRATGRAHIARATLESVCYQTYDLLAAMAADASLPQKLRVDGGMVANNWVTQFLADILNIHIDRPAVTETTALGVAFLAGIKAGLYSDLDMLERIWQLDRCFEPQMSKEESAKNLAGWRDAVKRVLA